MTDDKKLERLKAQAERILQTGADRGYYTGRQLGQLQLLNLHAQAITPDAVLVEETILDHIYRELSGIYPQEYKVFETAYNCLREAYNAALLQVQTIQHGYYKCMMLLQVDIQLCVRQALADQLKAYGGQAPRCFPPKGRKLNGYGDAVDDLIVQPLGWLYAYDEYMGVMEKYTGLSLKEFRPPLSELLRKAEELNRARRGLLDMGMTLSGKEAREHAAYVLKQYPIISLKFTRAPAAAAAELAKELKDLKLKDEIHTKLQQFGAQIDSLMPSYTPADPETPEDVLKDWDTRQNAAAVDILRRWNDEHGN